MWSGQVMAISFAISFAMSWIEAGEGKHEPSING